MAPDRFVALKESNRPLAESLEYWHVPLQAQLGLGLRKLELDVFYDPDGSLFGRSANRSACPPSGCARATPRRTSGRS